MLKALIFDFDGVIIDTETEWYHVYQDWLRQQYDIEVKMEDFLLAVGSDGAVLHKVLDQKAGYPIDWDRFYVWSDKEMPCRASRLPAMKGVKELLEAAGQRGLKIALGSSSRRQYIEEQLKRLGLLSYFDVLSTSDLVKKVKPEPDIFLKAAELLQVKPEECLIIEDSDNGRVAANRAGIPCLLVPNEITKHCHFENYYMMAESLNQVNLDAIAEDFI